MCDPHYTKPNMADSQAITYSVPSAEGMDVGSVDAGMSDKDVVEEIELLLRYHVI